MALTVGTGPFGRNETGRVPVHYFPEQDVRDDLLEATTHTTRCPFKGDAAYWTIRVGGGTQAATPSGATKPLAGAPPLAGYLAFHWDAVDEWWEETERIGVHARDPYHRCDVVRVGGQVVADSRRPTLLFETGLSPRFYLPFDDVRTDLLGHSDARTWCPHKATTSRYCTVVAGDERVEDAAWVYDEPHAEAAGIAGLVAFHNEKVDLEVDGEP